MEKVKSKITLNHPKGNIKIGDSGKADRNQLNDTTTGSVDVYFFIHQTTIASEWEPVSISKNHIERTGIEIGEGFL